MIKLPIILSEHKSWEQAVINSIQARQKLEEIAGYLTCNVHFIGPLEEMHGKEYWMRIIL